MATIVTRSGKGSELTHAELDANFTNLNEELAGKQASLTVATQAEMEAGTEVAVRSMSPLRVAQAINVLAGSNLLRSARTSNTALATTDKGKLIDITSGTFTQTFADASTLGDGWFCYIRNSGTGDITLDPNAAELIDGLSSYIMYPGEVRLVQCDGATLRSVVLSAFYKTITSSATFTKPPGYSAFEGLAWSGGQSGQKLSGAVDKKGGMGGGCFPFHIRSDLVPTSVSVVIGAGGAKSANNLHNPGGNTTFGTLLTVYGAGVNGADVPGSVCLWRSVASGQPGNFEGGGTGTSGNARDSVFGGGNHSTTLLSGANGGGSIYGGGAGQGVTSTGQIVSAGASVFGGSGGTGQGADGAVPSGGGAWSDSINSGAGARGELRIWGII